MGSTESKEAIDERTRRINLLAENLKHRQEESLNIQKKKKKCLGKNPILGFFTCYEERENVKLAENKALRATQILELAIKSNKDYRFFSNGEWKY